MNTKLVIYPKIKSIKDDLDIIASVWIMNRFSQDKADYLDWNFDSKEIPDIQFYKTVFMIKCAFSKAIMINWADEGKNFVIINNCVSDLSDSSKFTGRISYIFDSHKSCSFLTWDTIFWQLEPIPIFLSYVQNKDSKKLEFSDFKEINNAIIDLLVSLDKFGEPKLKMIFDWFDYLATLPKSKLSDYLRQATGLDL